MASGVLNAKFLAFGTPNTKIFASWDVPNAKRNTMVLQWCSTNGMVWTRAITFGHYFIQLSLSSYNKKYPSESPLSFSPLPLPLPLLLLLLSLLTEGLLSQPISLNKTHCFLFLPLLASFLSQILSLSCLSRWWVWVIFQWVFGFWHFEFGIWWLLGRMERGRWCWVVGGCCRWWLLGR